MDEEQVEQVRQIFLSATTEVLEIRFGEWTDDQGRITIPFVGASQQDVLAVLLRVRARIDRVEYVLATILQQRGQLKRLRETAQLTYEQAWDARAATELNSPVRRGDEYQGARERYALHNLATREQKFQVKKLEDLLSLADDALETIRLNHRGLLGIRDELLAVLRSNTFESHLER